MTLADVVRARSDRWDTVHELLALIADRVGTLASGQHYREPVPRIRRPHEPDTTVQAMGWGEFARLLNGGTAAA